MSKVVRTFLSADKDARLKMLGRSALNLAANTNHVTACGPLPDASEVHQLVPPSVRVCVCVRARARVRTPWCAIAFELHDVANIRCIMPIRWSFKESQPKPS